MAAEFGGSGATAVSGGATGSNSNGAGIRASDAGCRSYLIFQQTNPSILDRASKSSERHRDRCSMPHFEVAYRA